MKNTTDCKELALKKVNISGNVIGKFGTFEIEQTFVNNTNKVLEVGYTFPIVETATVVGFEVIVGDKVLKGQCKEKEKARKEYQKNIVKGNSAYMLEEESENIFSITVGKLAKNEEVTIRIKFIDKFDIVDNQIQILIPTLVPPKYNCRIVDRLNYGKVQYTVDFHINVSKNLGISSITSDTHVLNLTEDETNQKVEVLRYDMSRDFKLNISLKKELSSNALVVKTRDNEDILYLSFMPEILDSYEDSEKEYVFIIDVSGSMEGEKLEETKHAVIECLRELDEGDKFNIVAFSSEYEVMCMHALEYNEYNLTKAIKYVNSLEANGGTEILSPIQFALYEKDKEKIILLFTDGEVGEEDEIISFVEKNINHSRIFPFGIDTNVNSFFIKELANVGQGKAELIMPGERIDDKIIRTFARIQTPILEDLTIDYGENKVEDEIRESNALFNYEFFNSFVKVHKFIDDITLKGHILDKEYSWKIRKEDAIKTDVDLEVLFAKEEIDRLENYIKNTYDDRKIKNYKKMIIKLAEKYNINSKYTSFITVYERGNKIYEVPKYQETTLSNKSLFGSLKGMVQFFSKPDYDEDCCYSFDCGDYATPEHSFFATRSSGGKVLSHPKNLSKSLWSNDEEDPEETYTDKLREMMEMYCDALVVNDKQTLLTYLMYVNYLLYVRSPKFNYNKLLRTLDANRQLILESEVYQQLLRVTYKGLQANDIENAETVLDYLDDDYRKAALTNMKLSVSYDLDKLAEDEIETIVETKNISEKIDGTIEYFYTH